MAGTGVDWPACGPRPDPEQVIHRWLKDQTQRRVELEARLDSEAAERDVLEYRWMRSEAGGLASGALKYLFFLPMELRDAIARLEAAVWQLLLAMAPDVLWGLVFTVLLAYALITAPVVNWGPQTYALCRTFQGVASTLMLYWTTRNILFRVLGDWRFRNRLRWWASQGYVDAQFSLGSIYEAGDGIRANPRLATHWFHKAAQNGHCEAQYCLGECYYRGYGVPINLREARKWYQRAANQGDEDAEIMEDHIKKLMELPEYKAAQANAQAGAKAVNLSDPDRCGCCAACLEAAANEAQAAAEPAAGHEEERQRRKETQRKEYEVMEAQRRIAASEKRKAKAEKQRKEKEKKEKDEAATARQAAKIAALVEEESRCRARSSPQKDNPKASKKSAAGTKPSKGSRKPSSAEEARLVGPSSVEAAAQLIADKERQAAEAADRRSVTSKAAETAHVLELDANSASTPGKKGKINGKSRGASNAKPDKSASSTRSGSPTHGDSMRSGGSSQDLTSLSIPASYDGPAGQYSPPAASQGSARHRMLWVQPPPPPPPRRSKPTQQQQQPVQPSQDISGTNWARATTGRQSPPEPIAEAPAALGGWNPLQGGAMPWARGEDFLGGIIGSIGGGQHSPAAALAAPSLPPSTAGLDSPGLSAMAAHYLQRAGPSDSLPQGSYSDFSSGSVFSAFPGAVPAGSGDSGWLMSPTRNRRPVLEEDFHSLDDDHVCVVCLDREPGGAILKPCGHTQLCLACADAVHANGHGCPICRLPIEGFKRI